MFNWNGFGQGQQPQQGMFGVQPRPQQMPPNSGQMFGGLAGLGGQMQRPPGTGGGMGMGIPQMMGQLGGMTQPQQQPQQPSPEMSMGAVPQSWNGVGRFPFAGISKAATGFNR